MKYYKFLYGYKFIKFIYGYMKILSQEKIICEINNIFMFINNFIFLFMVITINKKIYI